MIDNLIQNDSKRIQIGTLIGLPPDEFRSHIYLRPGCRHVCYHVIQNAGNAEIPQIEIVIFASAVFFCGVDLSQEEVRGFYIAVQDRILSVLEYGKRRKNMIRKAHRIRLGIAPSLCLRLLCPVRVLPEGCISRRFPDIIVHLFHDNQDVKGTLVRLLFYGIIVDRHDVASLSFNHQRDFLPGCVFLLLEILIK